MMSCPPKRSPHLPPLFGERITLPPPSLLLTFNNVELTYNLPEGHQSGEPDDAAVDPECPHSASAKPLKAFFIAAKCK